MLLQSRESCYFTGIAAEKLIFGTAEHLPASLIAGQQGSLAVVDEDAIADGIENLPESWPIRYERTRHSHRLGLDREKHDSVRVRPSMSISQ